MASSDGLSAKDVRPEVPGRFRLRSISEIAEGSFREDLIEGLVPARAFGQLYGASSSGKSFLAQDMSFCTASGAQFHGREVLAGTALYIAAEGVNGLPDRIRAWNGGEVPSADSPLNTRIHVLSDQLDLNNPNDVKALLEIASQLDPLRFVFVDTLSRCMSGDENSSRDMNQVVRACCGIKEQTDATVILIHHSGWGESPRERGSSVLRAATDFTLRTEKTGSKVTLTCVKMRDGSPPKPMHFELAQVAWSDKDGQRASSCRLRACGREEVPSKPRFTPLERAVLHALGQLLRGEMIPRADLATILNAPDEDVLAALNGLIVQRLVDKDGNTRGTKYFLAPLGWDQLPGIDSEAIAINPGASGDCLNCPPPLKGAAIQSIAGLEPTGAANGSEGAGAFFPNVESSEAGGASPLSDGPEAEPPDGWGTV